MCFSKPKKAEPLAASPAPPAPAPLPADPTSSIMARETAADAQDPGLDGFRRKDTPKAKRIAGLKLG